MWLQATTNRHNTEMFALILLADISLPLPHSLHSPALHTFLYWSFTYPPEAYDGGGVDERPSVRRRTAVKQSQAGVLQESRRGKRNRHLASFVLAVWGHGLIFCK